MKHVIMLGVAVVGAFLGAAPSSEAAIYTLAGPQLATITKAGGNFGYTPLVGVTSMQASEVANYTKINIEVSATGGSWTADGNVGLVWNVDGAGFNNNIAVEWFWQGKEATLTLDYSSNTAFKNAFANRAANIAAWAEFGIDSNWPVFTGSNQYQIASVYLSAPVPEPVALTSLAGVALLALRRR